MTSRLRIALHGFVLFALLITAQTMAVARGQVMVAGQIVLCTGTGPMAVWVDENGAPMEAPHLCPDCALTVFDVADASPDWPLQDARLVPVAHLWQRVAGLSQAGVAPQARGPPVLV